MNDFRSPERLTITLLTEPPGVTRIPAIHMPVEIYFALKDGAVPVTLPEAQTRFADAGIPCTIEPEAPDMHWLVFEPHETNILASTKNDKLVFATIQASMTDDDPEFIEKLGSVLESMGLSENEDEDY